ncbi:MAG: DMT family transporter [Hyphomicrobiales bacterium]|nr:DMT family transporter [Hyphomicrobiales bacterium]MCP4998085.1 DMT family transporter [Hyphomicrobiales bacterium]
MVLGLIGVVLFGATLPMTHLGLQGFSPLFLTFSRALIASTAAVVYLVLTGYKLPLERVFEAFLAGLLLVFGFPGFATLAMETVPASHGSVILGLLPLLTAVFAALIGGERPGPVFWGVGMLGAALVVTFSLLRSHFSLTLGDFWLLAAGLSVSLGYVLSARLSRIMSGGATISWALILTLPISATGTALTWKTGIGSPGAPALWALLYLGFFSMFAGFLFWNAGLAMGGIARVGQMQVLQTFVTLALSALLLSERISTMTVLFAVAVAAVVWLGRKARIS